MAKLKIKRSSDPYLIWESSAVGTKTLQWRMPLMFLGGMGLVASVWRIKVLIGSEEMFGRDLAFALLALTFCLVPGIAFLKMYFTALAEITAHAVDGGLQFRFKSREFDYTLKPPYRWNAWMQEYEWEDDEGDTHVKYYLNIHLVKDERVWFGLIDKIRESEIKYYDLRMSNQGFPEGRNVLRIPNLAPLLAYMEEHMPDTRQ